MPHANMDQVNGDNSSKLLTHLEQYPVVSDSINAVKSNPYGQKAINTADAGYKNFVAPVASYAQKPYGYVAPYVNKADQLADGALSKVDKKFPVVKQDTEKIYSSVLDLAFLPLRLAGYSKDYAFDTYSKEYKKCGGDGYVAGGKAIITSSLIVSSDAFAWLANFLSQKKEQAKEVTKEKTGN